MKNFRALLAASALTLAVTNISMAAGTLSGAGAPPVVTASGTIEKYINFTLIDTTIDMGNFDGPGATGTVVEDDPADIEFDSNTHLQLDIVNGADFSNVDDVGVNIDAEGEDTMPTQFRTSVKGVDVIAGFGEFVSSSTYVDAPAPDGLTPSNFPQPSILYGHGPQSGVQLGAQVERTGLNDHFGQYKTSLDLTWADLN